MYDVYGRGMFIHPPHTHHTHTIYTHTHTHPPSFTPPLSRLSPPPPPDHNNKVSLEISSLAVDPNNGNYNAHMNEFHLLFAAADKDGDGELDGKEMEVN